MDCKIRIVRHGFVIIGLALAACAPGTAPSGESPVADSIPRFDMKLTSPAFPHNGSIPPRFTCDGKDISPPLVFADIPPEAESLALIVDDPDVPKSIRADGMWDHWIVFNIPPSTTGTGEGVQPAGIAGRGTGGSLGYGGPCPPDGEHRYFFRLFALDSFLDLSEGASKKDVKDAMNGHILAQAELMGRYDRRSASSADAP